MRNSKAFRRARVVTAAALGVSSLSLVSLVRADDGTGLYRWRGEAGGEAGQFVVSRGEAIWNDYLFDDYGANVDTFHSGNNDRPTPVTGIWPNPQDPASPRFGGSANNNRFRHSGDFSYPPRPNDSSGGYDNVADIIETRVAVDGGDAFFRFQFSTLTAPAGTVVGVALDGDRSAATGGGAWPFGARLDEQQGWEAHLTLWGTGGAVTLPGGMSTDIAAAGGTVRVDLAANVIEARVPRRLLGAAAGSERWRLVAGAGRWDAANRAWAEVPVETTQSNSPGALLRAPKLFDLAFNTGELNTYWDDALQSDALNYHRASEAGTLDVDVRLLERDASVEEPCRTGVRQEYHDSRMRLGEGLTAQRSVFGQVNYIYNPDRQPHSVLVPSGYCDAARPAPSLDLFLHPLNGNHNLWLVGVEDSATPRQNHLVDKPLPYRAVQGIADRHNRIVASSLARGEGVGYDGIGEADVLETFAQVRREYRHDPEHVRLTGMSMGAIGATRWGPLHPEAFSHLVAYNGATNSARAVNLRNLPVVQVYGDTGLDTVLLPSIYGLNDRLDGLGYEHLAMEYVGRAHDFNLVYESWPIVEAWTSSPRKVPARVTYRTDPADRNPNAVPQLEDGTAWVSGMELGEPAAAGTADLTSLARASLLPTQALRFSGLYVNPVTGNQIRFDGLTHHTEQQLRARTPDRVQAGWREVQLTVTPTALARPAEGNGVSGTLTNLSAVRVDLRDAGIDGGRDVTVDITTDRATTLTLVDGGHEERIQLVAGRNTLTLEGGIR